MITYPYLLQRAHTRPQNIPTPLSPPEYPSELEMSPGSSVVTSYVDVTGGSSFDKQHIRSASGTVFNQDIDEILKQV